MLGIGLSPLRAHPGRWWPEGAVYAADFVSNRYMRNGVEIPAAAAFSFSRASGKMAPDRAGAWHSFPPDVPARTNRGLLLEGAETYYPTNAAFAGLVPGTIGAGGALATGWECSVGGGGTLTVEATATLGGLPGVVVTWDIDNTANVPIYPNIRFAAPAAAQGETWTGGLWYDAVDNAGDTGIDSTIVLQERQGGTFLSAMATTVLPAGGSRQSVTRTLNQPNVETIWFLLSHVLPPGHSLKRTMTISLPTLTKSGALSSPQVTQNGVLLRAADLLTLHLPAAPQDLEFAYANGAPETIPGVSGDHLVASSGRTVTQVFGF